MIVYGQIRWQINWQIYPPYRHFVAKSGTNLGRSTGRSTLYIDILWPRVELTWVDQMADQVADDLADLPPIKWQMKFLINSSCEN